MKSPFQYGTLVDKESFVNRVEERKQLKELLGSGINVMLISPRRWGKSSLVKVAMDELTQEDKHIRVCFIDAFSIKTEAEFYRIFAREVISCAASTLEKRLEDVKQFLKAVSPSITLKSDPTDTLSFDLKLELEEKSVMEILELPEKIAAAKGIHLIVCIDEFQQLALLPGYKSMEGKMRSAWQKQQQVSYCFYGSKRHMMMDIFNNSSNPFYRFGPAKDKERGMGALHRQCLPPDEQRNQRTASRTTVRHREMPFVVFATVVLFHLERYV